MLRFRFLFSLTWSLFFVFTFLHIYANFRAVSSVVMETVSLDRLHLLVTEFLSAGRIMTPEEVGSREPVVFGNKLHKPHNILFKSFIDGSSSVK